VTLRMFRVRVPATTANLGSGFDSFGMALCLYNEIEVDLCGTSLVIDIEGEGANELSKDASNLVYRGIVRALKQADVSVAGLRLKLTNRIPLESGLGSSASAIVGGLVLGNCICGNVLNLEQLLELAVDMEGHPDNVVPALVGGFTVCCMNEGSAVIYAKHPVPEGLEVVVALPESHVCTAQARAVLPKSVPLGDAVFNLSRAALLVSAFISQDFELLKVGMQDRLHHPYRLGLIPGAEDAIRAAYNSGALGAAVSGSGPSIIALAKGNTACIAKQMLRVFECGGQKCRIIVTRPTMHGAVVIAHA
jgi:homoserine kinase